MQENQVWSHNIQVVLRDLDGLGHVNNAVYATYLETARNTYVAELSEKPLAVDQFDFILARLEIDFLKPALLAQWLSVEVWPTAVGNKSFRLAYNILGLTDSQIYLKARSVQVAYDYQLDASRSVPEPLRTALTREQDNFETGQNAPPSDT